MNWRPAEAGSLTQAIWTFLIPELNMLARATSMIVYFPPNATLGFGLLRVKS